MSNIKFKKSLMAVAAGVALAGAGMTAANAESLLFPYFSTQGGASSYLLLSSGTGTAFSSSLPGTVVNAGKPGQRVTGGNIHYVCNVFPSGTALSGGVSTCTHIDAYGSMTQNDTIFQEVSSLLTPTPFADNSVPALLPELNAGVVQGFMVVTDAATPATAAGANTLKGQMIVADPTSGSLFAYNGIASASTTEGDFSGITDANFALQAYPQGVSGGASFNSKWYALAVGNMNANIVAGSNWTSTKGTGSSAVTATGQVTSAYDNDENNLYSGATPTVSLGCAATYKISDLLPTGNTNAAAFAASGGQMKLAFTTAGSNASGVVLTKIDAVQLGSGVNWTATGAVLFTAENPYNANALN
jgi:hypothetical protein